MYTRRFSPDCMRAKGLLDRKGVTYSEFIIDSDLESEQVMLQRSGGSNNVPQIFINGRTIGGLPQLEALDASGQLDVMLGERPRNILAEEAEAADQNTDPPSGGRGLFSLFRRS